MKCKIIYDTTRIGLETKINDFLKNIMVLKNISYATYKSGYTPEYSVVIIYE